MAGLWSIREFWSQNSTFKTIVDNFDRCFFFYIEFSISHLRFTGSKIRLHTSRSNWFIGKLKFWTIFRMADHILAERLHQIFRWNTQWKPQCTSLLSNSPTHSKAKQRKKKRPPYGWAWTSDSFYCMPSELSISHDFVLFFIHTFSFKWTMPMCVHVCLSFLPAARQIYMAVRSVVFFHQMSHIWRIFPKHKKHANLDNMFSTFQMSIFCANKTTAFSVLGIVGLASLRLALIGMFICLLLR